jgi:hypothetical protein
VNATRCPSPETAGSEANPGVPSLIGVVTLARRSRSITREVVAPGLPSVRLVTAVNATNRPSADILGS